MLYIKPEYLLRTFQIFTNPASTVEFEVNDSNAVVLSVIDNGELTSATLMSNHANAHDANTAKEVYEAAFKNYREGNQSMNEKIKIKLTLEDAIAFINSTVSVNENHELVVTIVRNGVTETKVISTHATAEEAEAEKVEHEKMIADFKSHVSDQLND